MISQWLAFDIGTTGIKAAILDAKGRALQSSSRGYAPVNPPAAGEQNVTDWWEALISAVKDLDCTDVEAIAITGQMQDLILLNVEKKPIRPAILYNDTRAEDEIEKIRAKLSDEMLRATTGNDQDASSLLAKLLWVQKHEPQNIKNCAHILMGAADYIALQLTGTFASDTTTASTTGLLDIRTHSAFSGDIGISSLADRFPKLVPGGSLIGTVQESAAQQLGLQAGIPVHLGPGDAGAATLGVGGGDIGHPYAYVGTSGWIGLTLPHLTSPDTGAFNLVHPKQDRYFCLAPLLTAGGNVDWAAHLFSATDYDKFIDEALERSSTDLLYLPYLNGERSPFRDTKARGAFIGLEMHHQRADLCRAILEGIIFAYRHALETLNPTKGETLILTGGGTRSLTWCQLFANILNIPITVADDAEFVGVRGAVLAAQVANGDQSSFTPPDYFPMSVTLHPHSNHAYDSQYARFRSAYLALKPVFHSV
jgi:xylulokinase